MDSNMRADPLKLLEDNVGRALEDGGRGMDLLHRTQKIMPTTNKCDLRTLKSFFTANT